MRYFRTTDYVAIALYLLTLIAIALFLRKKSSRSIKDYFLGDNQLPWWALGISGTSSYIDMAGTMLIVSFLYLLGPRGLYIEFRGGAVLILTFMLLWSGKWHRRSGCMTGAEWMEFRFGKSWYGQAARVISAVAVVVTTIGMLVYLMKALGLFVAMFIPFTPAQCVLVMVMLATIYTAVSGFYGVGYTDLFQSVIVISAIVIVSVTAIGSISATGSFPAVAASVTGNREWINSSLPWKINMPPGYRSYDDLTMLVIFYFLRNMLIGISSAGADPRYFAARNDRECGTLTFFWTSLMMFRWPMMIGFAIIGIVMVHHILPNQLVLSETANFIRSNLHGVTRAEWPAMISGLINTPSHFSPALTSGVRHLLNNHWQTKLSLLSYDGTINPERIVPAVILFDLPTGVRGFLVIALIAAAFSSFNSSVNSATGYFTRDLYQRFIHPDAKTRELIGISYVFIVCMVLAAYSIAFYFRSITQIWGWIVMGLGGGLAVPAVLKFYWWRYNGGGFAIGTAVGILASIAEIRFLPHLVEWQQFVLVASISLAATVIGTLLTPPVEDSVAFNFYRTTRPFGLWGPFRSRLAPNVRKAMEKEQRNDLLAVPFTLGWQISLFFLPMQLMIRNFSQFYFTLTVFLFCLAGMYIFWYRNLPPKTPYGTEKGFELSNIPAAGNLPKTSRDKSVYGRIKSGRVSGPQI